MNRNYVYWDVDSTDWEETYSQYRGIFSQLNLNDDNDVRQSVKHFREMTKNLVDGHCFISFKHPAIADSVIYPLMERKEKLGLTSEQYFYFLKDSVYLDKGYLIGQDSENTLNNELLTTICGEINGDILYFSCNFFELSQSYHSSSSESVKATLDYFFSWTERSSEESGGIIIDVRNNPGGDLADLNFLLGRLVDNPLNFGYCQYKNGDDPFSFTPEIKAYINPEPGGKDVELPIVVLADAYTASLAELVTNAVRAFPQGSFIGESTWGATSPVVPYEVYNSGSFEIHDFLDIQLSSCKFISLDGRVYEGTGFTPDIFIPHSAEAYNAGTDLQLERAIELLK